MTDTLYKIRPLSFLTEADVVLRAYTPFGEYHIAYAKRHAKVYWQSYDSPTGTFVGKCSLSGDFALDRLMDIAERDWQKRIGAALYVVDGGEE